MQGKIPFHASTPLTELLCRGNTLNSLGSSRAGAMGGTQVLTLTPSQKYFGPPEERGGGMLSQTVTVERFWQHNTHTSASSASSCVPAELLWSLQTLGGTCSHGPTQGATQQSVESEIVPVSAIAPEGWGPKDPRIQAGSSRQYVHKHRVMPH